MHKHPGARMFRIQLAASVCKFAVYEYASNEYDARVKAAEKYPEFSIVEVVEVIK